MTCRSVCTSLTWLSFPSSQDPPHNLQRWVAERNRTEVCPLTKPGSADCLCQPSQMWLGGTPWDEPHPFPSCRHPRPLGSQRLVAARCWRCLWAPVPAACRGRGAGPLQEPPSVEEQGPRPFGCGWVTSSAPAPTVLGAVGCLHCQPVDPKRASGGEACHP